MKIITEPETTQEEVTEEITTEEETTTVPKITFQEETTTAEQKTTAEEEEEEEREFQDSGEISDLGYDDAYLIACLLSGEVGFTNYECMWASADMILNEVESPLFPNNVYDVLHNPGIFDAVNWWYIPGTSVPSYLYYIANGPIDECLTAAYDAMNNRGKSHGYYNFCCSWFFEENPEMFEDSYGEYIGGEYFYNWNWQ